MSFLTFLFLYIQKNKEKVDMYNTLNQNGMGKIIPPGVKVIKDSALTESELKDLRESFVIQYATSKGWDPNKLTSDQLKEIFSDKRWQNPGLLLS